MSEKDGNKVNEFLGTTEGDEIVDGYQSASGKTLTEKLDAVDKVNGHAGDDTISTGEGNDLAAGDMVGDEWTYDGERWVYNPEAVVVSDEGNTRSYNDNIATGAGNDVLLGNGGDDTLNSGSGNDIVNAGTGNDRTFGGDGDDLLNLEDGDDYAEGGQGDDIVNAGDGDDIVYGDLKVSNLLSGDSSGLTSFAQLSEVGGWTMTDDEGQSVISKSTNTNVGENYTISFELAANLSGGHETGKVEVLWNGDVVDIVEATSGVFQTFQVDVEGAGSEGMLSFRAVEPASAADTYNFDGPVISYKSSISIEGIDVDVTAFAPGQAQLYQVIDGQLKAFDVETKEYIDVVSAVNSTADASGLNIDTQEYTGLATAPNFNINAVGFNVEDDLIYGVAKSSGTDSLGNPVASTDIVMIDATGSAFRIGEGFYGDYVGDFDDSGNLWTFHSSLNRVSVVDVDSRDADGNPEISHFDLPDDIFTDRTFDLAFNSGDGNFYAVVSPGTNGGAGKVVKIDVSAVENGGTPTFAEIPITGTLYGDTMESGMAKGAYGAVFMDGDANLYFGLNRGDHDLDSATGSQGAIFKVNVDWDTGQAYSEFMSETQSTGSNDGTVDPRSADAFGSVDADAAVLIRNPELTSVAGGNDDLRGGDGNDVMFGNEGDDQLHGGTGDDQLSGDEGSDIINAGTGNDIASGGSGEDKIRGEAGDDMLSGNEGKDYIDGGSGDDRIDGGADADKIVGGTGADTIEGGAGDDHIWGGNWSGDKSSDTFIVAAGSGKDIIHDFEAEHDRIDLSSYGLEFDELQSAMRDHGWATEIDLSAFDGSQDGDRLFLKSVQTEDLDETNFIL